MRTTDRTGVEMEALTAVSVAALTLYDMLKAVDPAATIDGIAVVRKDGGKTGTWEQIMTRSARVIIASTRAADGRLRGPHRPGDRRLADRTRLRRARRPSWWPTASAVTRALSRRSARRSTSS